MPKYNPLREISHADYVRVCAVLNKRFKAGWTTEELRADKREMTVRNVKTLTRHTVKY